MNWFDNLIGFFSPRAAAERQAWRAVLEESRHYDAGDYSRLNSNWTVTNQSAELTDRYSRDIVRARARDLERNSDFLNSIVGPFVRNVVGRGFILQAETDNDELNQQIEHLWKTWCKKRNCDVTGCQGFTQLLRMAVRRKKIDGGILFVKCFTPGGILPFKLQLIEVDEFAVDQIAPNTPGNRVVGGVEYNPYNAPAGYWIRRYEIDGTTPINPAFIPAKDAIFYFSKRRPSQIREMSDIAHSITRIRDTNEFITAVSVKQRIEACLAIFIKRSVPTQGLGRAGSSPGPRHSYEGKTLAPGMIKELNVGDEIQVVNPQGQSTDASAYIKLQQHIIGAGQGLSYEATSRDMSESTYSSARQGTIEDSFTFAEEDELLQDVLSEIYETFIISAWLAGQLQIPDLWERKETYFAHSFTHPPKGWIDPSKEVTATQIALQTGQKTFKQVAAENGADWRKQIDDIVECLDYAQEKGIDLGGVIFGNSTAKAAGPDALPEDGQQDGDGDTLPDGDGDSDEGEPEEGQQ